MTFDNSGTEDRPGPNCGALYLHVPFCTRKCRYCDFYSIVGAPALMDAYMSAVPADIDVHLRDGRLRTPLESVYIGGGTPTCLGPARMGALLEKFTGLIDRNTEFTVETDPGIFCDRTAEVLSGGGVNRVTLGAQTFDERLLNLLGRTHLPEDIARSVHILREAGMDNLAVDLMYGLPGEDTGLWLGDVRAAMSLGFEHVSIYALTLEGGTAMADDAAAGRIAEVPDGHQREMYYRAAGIMKQGGYEHYEISNFAMPGRRCRHNQVYWRNCEYVGIGPAAASYLGGLRWVNTPDVEAYISCLETGREIPRTSENLRGKKAAAETLMLWLRLVEGVELEQFKRRYGADPRDIFPDTINRCLTEGVLVKTSTHLRFGNDYLFTSDSVFSQLLAEAE